MLGENIPTPIAQTESQPSPLTVNMLGGEFAPKQLTIKKGTVVTFINLDRARHTVTSDDRKFDSGVITSGQSFTMTFDEVGAFPYYCDFHGGKGGVDMAGTIVVQ